MVFQLGDEIIDFFGDPLRGANQGKNDNGVEIEYVLLSLESTVTFFDNSIINSARNNGYTQWGLDSTSNRTADVRVGMSHYRGEASTPPPGSLAFADRRRVVVVDVTDGNNPVIRHNDRPLDSGALGATNVNLIRAAINAASPQAPGLDYLTWSSGFNFAEGEGDFDDDPDRDGWRNGFEFFAGTNPLLASSAPLVEFEQTATGFSYAYQRATDRVGVSHSLQAGPLDSLSTFTPMEADVIVTDMGAGIERVEVELASEFGPFLRQFVEAQ